MALVGIVVGGLYLALQLVPAAPPRTQDIGSVRVTFTTDPRVPWAGPAEVTIWVVDAAGFPVAEAEVTLYYDMERDSIGRPMSGMGEPGRSPAGMDSRDAIRRQSTSRWPANGQYGLQSPEEGAMSARARS
jgi:hypothetical protein